MRKVWFSRKSFDTLLFGSSRSPKVIAPAMQELAQAGVASASTPGGGIDAVDAERAFGGDIDATWIGARGFRSAGFAIVGKRLAVHDLPRLVRTRHCAITAADANVIVDRDQAVGTLLGGLRRAHSYARRVAAMVAADRHKAALNVGIFASFKIKHFAPLHAGRRRVGVATSGGAGLATDTTTQIYCHHKASHAVTFYLIQ